MAEQLTPEQMEALRRWTQEQNDKAIREKEDKADRAHNNRVRKN